MEFLSTVVDSILSVVVNITIKQVKYAFCTSKNVNDLQSAAKALLAKRVDVGKQIKLDEPKGREVTEEVREWIDHVESVKKEIEEIQEKYEQRYIIFGCCSPNCFSNYGISKNAAEKLIEVQGLCDKGNNFDIERVTMERSPQPVHMLPATSSNSSSQNSNLNLALEYVNNNELGMIGIWGMGGVGKTHLLKQINDSLGGSFDHIIYVTASKECSVEKIQNGIAKWLKLENVGGGIELSAGIISNFLSEKSFLFLLDDLWERVDLLEVGIPFPLGGKRKVVFTTRKNGICGQMEAEKKIKVNCLSEEDAWRLFEEKVGLETIRADPAIPTLARELVAELDGLPLALVTIGRAMRDKKYSKIWENDIRLLKESRVTEIEESMFKRLKFSYDNLKSEILKQCFLICSLWPEDYYIDKEELIERWMGLGAIEDYDGPEIYNQGYALVHDLQAACLLEEVEDVHYDNYYDTYSNSRVTMHDVIRDMALWIARDCGKNKNKWIVKRIAGSGEMISLGEGVWREAEHIALYGNENHVNIPIINAGTNLKTFVLCCLEFKGIGNIAQFRITLTYLDLVNNFLEDFPQEICQLINLRYLNMSENSLDVLPEELRFLINLRFLILRDNSRPLEIRRGVLSEMKELIMVDLYCTEMLPKDLEFVYRDIGSLEKIKTLSISVSPDEFIFYVVNVPIRHLGIYGTIRLLGIYGTNSNESSFQVTSSFLENNNRRKSLIRLIFNLDHCKQLVFGNNEGDINWQFQNLETMDIDSRGLEEVVFVAIAPKDLFPKLTHLRIAAYSLKNYSWILYLPCLRILKISWVMSVEQLFTMDKANNNDVGMTTTIRPFPSLRYMRLYGCHITSICPPHITFPSLQHLKFLGCRNLKMLPFKKNTIPSNLKTIECKQEWWDNLEWEDDDLKSALQTYLKVIN